MPGNIETSPRASAVLPALILAILAATCAMPVPEPAAAGARGELQPAPAPMQQSASITAPTTATAPSPRDPAEPPPPPPPPPRPAWTAALPLRHPAHDVPDGVDNVVVHVPEGLDASAPLHLVIFLHGAVQCAAELALPGEVTCRRGAAPTTGYGLTALHDAAGSQSIFVVPQFAFYGSGGPGHFAEPGYFRSFVAELLAESLASGLGGPKGLDDLGSITLIAHSAGFMAATAILDRGDMGDWVRNVVLLDALFSWGLESFERWLAGSTPGHPRHIALLYRRWGRGVANARALGRSARALDAPLVVDPPSLVDAMHGHRVVVKESAVDHYSMPLLLLTEVVVGLGLPPRPLPPFTVSPDAGPASGAPPPPGLRLEDTLADGDARL